MFLRCLRSGGGESPEAPNSPFSRLLSQGFFNIERLARPAYVTADLTGFTPDLFQRSKPFNEEEK